MNLSGSASQTSPFIVYILLIWTLIWKGIALWHSAKNSQKNWFIAIFVTLPFINTLGILEIIYLFKFAKKKLILNDLYFWKSKI